MLSRTLELTIVSHTTFYFNYRSSTLRILLRLNINLLFLDNKLRFTIGKLPPRLSFYLSDRADKKNYNASYTLLAHFKQMASRINSTALWFQWITILTNTRLSPPPCVAAAQLIGTIFNLLLFPLPSQIHTQNHFYLLHIFELVY